MERARAKKVTKRPRVTELSRLKRDVQRLSKQLKSRDRELAEALEQQTATSKILGVIRSSPNDSDPVLNVIVENAARVCGADDATIRLVEGNILRLAAHHGTIPPAGAQRPIDRSSLLGRAIIDRKIIHIEDTNRLTETEFPGTHPQFEEIGIRTAVVIPLLREGVAIGCIAIRRTEVRPFTSK